MDYPLLKDVKKLEATPTVWTAKEVFDIIRKAPPNSAIIDAGCHHGTWTTNNMTIEPTIRIGVDIIDHGRQDLFDFFFTAALDIEEEERDIYTYSESAINSIYNRNPDLNYDNADFMTLDKVITMTTRRLESLLDEIENIEKIHYVKIDCQGNDANVAKSLGKYLSKTDYIQLETSFDTKNLYDVPVTYEDDIKEMKSIGFEPIYYCVQDLDNQFNMPIDGEILFKRKR